MTSDNDWDKLFHDADDVRVNNTRTIKGFFTVQGGTYRLGGMDVLAETNLLHLPPTVTPPVVVGDVLLINGASYQVHRPPQQENEMLRYELITL